MRKSVFVVLAISVLAVVFAINSCQKEVEQTDSKSNNVLVQDSYTIDILTFIDQYKFNSSILKSSDSISVDSAKKSLESAMNLMYTYYVKTSGIYSETSQIEIVVGKNKMSEDDVSDALEEIEDSVKIHFTNAPFTTKKLIAVSLEYKYENSKHKISITSYTGNTTLIASHPPYDWYEGRYAGDCDGTISGTDAAEEIQKIVQGLYWEEPPTGVKYFWPNPVEFDHFVGQDKPNSFTTYKNTPDPSPVNYKDYIVFYMADNLANYEDPHCMLGNDEMPFYKSEYRGLVDDALLTGTNYKFKECDFIGVKRVFGIAPNELTVLRHELLIIVGKRMQMNYNNNYPTSIE